MDRTAEATSRPAADLATRASGPLGDTSRRLAGLGGIAFVVIVILQNIIRGSSAPGNGATGDEVLRFYAGHRGITFVLIATFVLSGGGLATFLGGAMRRLIRSDRVAWAYTGLVGAIGIMVLFSVLVGCEEALSVAATAKAPDPGAMNALWALHNSVFTVLWLSIGVALIGLARAGVAAGITPRVFERLAPIGTGLLAIACVAGPAIAAGDAMAFFAVGLIGFLIWLAFLTTTGLRLVRSDSHTFQAVAA
jgi:hypothetical protein